MLNLQQKVRCQVAASAKEGADAWTNLRRCGGRGGGASTRPVSLGVALPEPGRAGGGTSFRGRGASLGEHGEAEVTARPPEVHCAGGSRMGGAWMRLPRRETGRAFLQTSAEAVRERSRSSHRTGLGLRLSCLGNFGKMRAEPALDLS